MRRALYELLGPSIFLLTLDLFLENPDEMMNLREIARRIDKNPGSISPIMPRLLDRGLLIGTQVGKVSIVYRLNVKNEFVKDLMEFQGKIASRSFE